MYEAKKKRILHRQHLKWECESQTKKIEFQENRFFASNVIELRVSKSFSFFGIKMFIEQQFLLGAQKLITEADHSMLRSM